MCLECRQSFSSNRRPKRLQYTIFNHYFYHRFTLNELAAKYNHSRQWIQDQIHTYQPQTYKRIPREVVLVLDATFFGKRIDKFGLIVAKDVLTLEVISYHFIRTESLMEYKDLRQTIEAEGFTIKAIAIDGKRGLFRLFVDIPVQMCHFHQKAILTRYLTKDPKLKASIDLKRISTFLGKVSEKRFALLLECWYQRHKVFFNDKTYNPETNKWHYTHRRVRSAYRSLVSNLPYLFIYKKYPDLNIPNTTNHLDGGLFAPMKMLLKIHRGIGIEMKKKLIIDYLENR